MWPRAGGDGPNFLVRIPIFCAIQGQPRSPDRGRGKLKRKKGTMEDLSTVPLNLLEAASGFEPLNNGFADHCLSHLATPPHV